MAASRCGLLHLLFLFHVLSLCVCVCVILELIRKGVRLHLALLSNAVFSLLSETSNFCHVCQSVNLPTYNHSSFSYNKIPLH